MGIEKLLEDNQFCLELEKTLDKLAVLYSRDTKLFMQVYTRLPRNISILLKVINNQKYEGTNLEDLTDYCQEVYGYYLSEEQKAKRIRLEEIERSRFRPFTLRNPDDLRSFGKFLDKMLYLLELSPTHFKLAITKCPTAYWDKIDDLRETSFKFNRDSEDYLQCLEKCKKISFTYSDMVDSDMNPEEEFFDSYEQNNDDE